MVAGASHTCAISSGGVWCWGHNTYGQLGDGQMSAPVLTPTPVLGLYSGVTSLSLGDLDSCATKNDGTVWCWGEFDGYAPGNGNPSSVPVRIAGIAPGATMVSTVGGHSCAGSATALQCWGLEYWGELGDGVNSSGDPVPPVEVHFNWG